MSEFSRTQFGLPSVATLDSYQIWDSYFTPSHSHPGADGSSRVVADIARSMRAIELGRIKKLCIFPHVGLGTTSDPKFEAMIKSRPELVSKAFEHWPGMLLGMIQLNPNQVSQSLDALDRWIRDDRMVGVYFPGGGPGSLPCSDPRFHPLVERILELKGLIMQHTWFVTGGKTSPGHSTPVELAGLAAKHPDQKFICAHAGGEWEKGIQAVRDSPNILIETSGFDATAGFIEMAVKELGAERILFGSHLPSRSLGTELGKITGAFVPEEAKRQILGQNYRTLLKPILETK